MPRVRQNPSYTNRSDLVGPSRLPVAAGPAQQYGDRAAQQAAQRALPVAPTPLALGSGAPAPAAAPPQPGNVLAQAASFNGPGEASTLDRPTERPDEPVTHGLPVGPGGGPEVLTGVGAATRNNTVEQGTLQHLLTNMAAAPGATSAIQDLAARAQGGAL